MLLKIMIVKIIIYTKNVKTNWKDDQIDLKECKIK